jgi:hypothetical protein
VLWPLRCPQRNLEFFGKSFKSCFCLFTLLQFTLDQFFHLLPRLCCNFVTQLLIRLSDYSFNLLSVTGPPNCSTLFLINTPSDLPLLLTRFHVPEKKLWFIINDSFYIMFFRGDSLSSSHFFTHSLSQSLTHSLTHSLTFS